MRLTNWPLSCTPPRPGTLSFSLPPPALKNLSFSSGVGGGGGVGREFENRLKYWVNHVPGNRWAMFGSSSENSSGSYVLLFLWSLWNFLDTRLLKGTSISWLDLSINQFIKVNAWDEVTHHIREKHKTIKKKQKQRKRKDDAFVYLFW